MRNGAYGADKFGFKRPRRSSLESRPSLPLYEHAHCGARSFGRRRAARSAPRLATTPAASPKDKHTVVDALTENSVWWDGNRKITQANFDSLSTTTSSRMRAARSCSRRTSMAAPIRNTGSRRRVFTELAWHSLFIRQLLIRPERAELDELRSRTHHRRSAVVQGRSPSAMAARLRRPSWPSISRARSC